MDEHAEETHDENPQPRNSYKKIIVTTLIASLAFYSAFIHYKYVSMLFENDRNFSHLSELEREMSLRTEMGFYYSYYKTVVETHPFVNSVAHLMYDRLVEYPRDVNAFNRFNIYPEVILGSLYKYFEPMINTSSHKVCHLVERGGGHSSVESCVGVGQPIYFYLEAVWWMAGLTVAALFLHAVVLSQSIMGGLLAVVQYFANHAECTRVQWAPNERENFAAPFLLLQMWLLTLQLKEKGKMTTLQLQVAIFIVNIFCILFWQFSQFIFLTQTAIFFLMEQLNIIKLKTLSLYLHSQFCSIQTAVLILQGNDMLKSSLFTSFFLVVSIYCLFFSSFRIKVQNRLDLFIESWLVILRILIVTCASLYLKHAISTFLEVEEDSHIWDILYSKFSDYKTFHTLIYTCSDVFDFLPITSVVSMTKSLLIPLVLLNIINFLFHWTSKSMDKCLKEIEVDIKDMKRELEDEDSGIENSERRATDLNDLDKKIEKKLKGELPKDILIMYLRNLEIDCAVFYNLSQLVVYGAMAALVMRLKLLFTAQMCVVFSLTFNKTYYALPKSVMRYMPVIWALYTVVILRAMVHNIGQEMAHVGEFSDYPQEQMLKWITREAGPGAFAGSMPVSATVMLATRKPIITHPHYEHLDARRRAYEVYKVYGRFPPHEYYQALNRLRATYLIVEDKYCYGRSNQGCSFEDIWDVEAPELAGAAAGAPSARPRLCHTLLTEHVEHFYQVFRNEHYAIFRIHDFSVRYMPRSFDT